MKSFIIIIALTLITVTACEILEPSNKKLLPIDSKIDFRVIETYPNYYEPSNPEITLEMRTEKIYGCLNHYIVSNLKKNGNEINVELVGIGVDNICFTALGPANGSVNLGSISGSYKLNIFSADHSFSDTYNLIVNDSSIIIKGKESVNTKPLINFYWRHPENSFAYKCIITDADSSLCDKFIDTLKTVITLSEFKFPDTGKNPYELVLGKKNLRCFYYKDEKDFDKITEVMKSFKQKYFPGGEVSLIIINWLNKSIQSSLL